MNGSQDHQPPIIIAPQDFDYIIIGWTHKNHIDVRLSPQTTYTPTQLAQTLQHIAQQLLTQQ